jgi:NADPH-dependent curcumin reductase CurA
MPAIANPSLIYNELPKGEPTLDTLKFDQSAEINLDAELNDNEIVMKLVSVSLDPYMRGRMRDESIKSYSPPFSLHKP